MGMYGSMVGRIAGTSSGARALRMMEPLSARVAGGLRSGASMAGHSVGGTGIMAPKSVGGRTAIAAGRAMKMGSKHPLRVMGGAAGAAGAVGMSRRRGSQNYPMY